MLYRGKHTQIYLLMGLLFGSFISTYTSESYHYALSRELTNVAWVKHGAGVRYSGPIEGHMMYTDIDIE